MRGYLPHTPKLMTTKLAGLDFRRCFGRRLLTLASGIFLFCFFSSFSVLIDIETRTRTRGGSGGIDLAGARRLGSAAVCSPVPPSPPPPSPVPAPCRAHRRSSRYACCCCVAARQLARFYFIGCLPLVLLIAVLFPPFFHDLEFDAILRSGCK